MHHTVDVYSTGLCLFALLYRGSSPPSSPPHRLDPDDLVAAIDRVRTNPATGIRPDLLLPGVPEGLAPLLRRMVAADPALRPPAQAVKDAVRAAVLGFVDSGGQPLPESGKQGEEGPGGGSEVGTRRAQGGCAVM